MSYGLISDIPSLNGDTKNMTTTVTPPGAVAYEPAARRHLLDADALYSNGRFANAGQLYGFVAECGLKAMLLACGVTAGADGGLPQKNPIKPKESHPLRQHMPNLTDRIAMHGQLIPDGARATSYMATLMSIGAFHDWSIDHRYWKDAALPTTSIANWRIAAKEICTMLDQAKQDGVL
jgi:hypothetical protein